MWNLPCLIIYLCIWHYWHNLVYSLCVKHFIYLGFTLHPFVSMHFARFRIHLVYVLIHIQYYTDHFTFHLHLVSNTLHMVSVFSIPGMAQSLIIYFAAYGIAHT